MSSDSQAVTLASRLDKLYEFERAPVTPDKLHSGRYFAGLFVGEHVAATEFVIGVLFVQWGASARDLIWGLALGNALAVLSWVCICTPIAVQTRLTLYWYVRRIIGPGLTVVYNFINAILYCCLAAAMIGVSASAVILALSKIGIRIRHPGLDDVYPNSVGWVVVVVIVGAVVVALAIMGFKRLSQFAAVCSPWMMMIFVAGAIASLPALGDIRSFDDLASLAKTKIWTGQPYEKEVFAIPVDARPLSSQGSVPDTLRTEFANHGVTLSKDAAMAPGGGGAVCKVADRGTVYVLRAKPAADAAYGPRLAVGRVLEKLGFWHIAFFAWFCNLAMHVGLSDMAIFRYAKHWTYGFYSAFGMYVGHFVAWICAGVMGAVVGEGLNPGQMADTAAGVAGILAVLAAGWTTANPTIYRAGLALQIVTPNWPRWKVTLVAGGITTIVGCFPAIFMRLLDFVAIYGLVLMPIGAVIVVEHWLFPRIGLKRYWAEKRGLMVNLPALIAWVAVLVICFPIEKFADVKSPMELLGVHLFFRWLPGWFIAAGLYVVLCSVFAGALGTRATGAEVTGKRAAPAKTDKRVLQPEQVKPLGIGAWIAGGVTLLTLAMCLFLPLSVFIAGSVPEAYAANMASYKARLLIVTVVYFVAATIWFSQRERARGAAG